MQLGISCPSDPKFRVIAREIDLEPILFKVQDPPSSDVVIGCNGSAGMLAHPAKAAIKHNTRSKSKMAVMGI